MPALEVGAEVHARRRPCSGGPPRRAGCMAASLTCSRASSVIPTPLAWPVKASKSKATDRERRFCQSQPVMPIPSACSVKENRARSPPMGLRVGVLGDADGVPGIGPVVNVDRLPATGSPSPTATLTCVSIAMRPAVDQVGVGRRLAGLKELVEGFADRWHGSPVACVYTPNAARRQQSSLP